MNTKKFLLIALSFFGAAFMQANNSPIAYEKTPKEDISPRLSSGCFQSWKHFWHCAAHPPKHHGGDGPRT